MDTYLTLKDAEIVRANKLGATFKAIEKVGKEYYAFYNVKPDTILEWIERKVKELVNTEGLHWSVVGVTHELLKVDAFRTSTQDLDMIYVHKKTLKRHIKKAVQRCKLRG